MKKSFSQNATKAYLVALLFITLISSCRKPDIKTNDGKGKSKLMTSSVPVTISMEEIYAQLPQTIMYNLAGTISIDVSLAEWRYEADYVMVRIPLNQATNKSYVYAVKTYANPTGRPHVYLSEFFPDAGSTRFDFTGRQMWINLQDWKVYGVKYAHNVATETMAPIGFNKTWESTMNDAGLFYISNNQIMVYDEPLSPEGRAAMRPTGDRSHGDELMKGGKGKGFFGRLFSGIGDIISGIGSWLGGLGDGSGGPGGGDYDGGGWDPWPPGGDYGGGGGTGGGGGGGGTGGGGGGGGSTAPPDDDDDTIINIWDNNLAGPQVWASAGNLDNNNPTIPVWVNGSALDNAISTNGSVYTVQNATVTYLVNTLGLNQTQTNWLSSHLDKASSIMTFMVVYVPGLTTTEKHDIAIDHLTMMMDNSDYLTQINNLTGNWWSLDQEELMEARKIQLQLYLQSSPYGLIDCNTLSQLPITMYQDVGSYQVPQSVLNRINDVRTQNSPAYTTSNFKIQAIQNAVGGILGNGRVNCDYFTVKINTLPTVNNVQLSADQFLEYFRTHINDFISSNISVNFQPYIDFVSGSVNINETTIFNSSYESSLGSIIHIDMADDGSIVESGYSRDFTTNHHNFTVTTMETPMDFAHPVAGNRRWGIFPSSGGGYIFYIMGVDRTNDYSTSFVNLGNVAFDGADDLWHSVQNGVQSFVNTHQGSSPSKDEVIARPRWDAAKDFLQGKISMAQYKAILHCP